MAQCRATELLAGKSVPSMVTKSPCFTCPGVTVSAAAADATDTDTVPAKATNNIVAITICFIFLSHFIPIFLPIAISCIGNKRYITYIHLSFPIQYSFFLQEVWEVEIVAIKYCSAGYRECKANDTPLPPL